ncbi:MAG TPA: HEPN domain-containing protein [Pyrinomonadaceae bacterium]
MLKLHKPPPTPLDHFSKALGEIALVNIIAKDLKRHDVIKADKKIGYLYRSYIVYLVAVWQTFLIELARASLEALIAKDANSILHEQLRSNLERQIKNHFKSPDTQNIDALVEFVTGIKKISNRWEWKGISNEIVKQRHAELLKLRNEIAHTAYSNQDLSVDTNYDYMKFLFNIGCILNNVIGEYIKRETGKEEFLRRELKY